MTKIHPSRYKSPFSNTRQPESPAVQPFIGYLAIGNTFAVGCIALTCIIDFHYLIFLFELPAPLLGLPFLWQHGTLIIDIDNPHPPIDRVHPCFGITDFDGYTLRLDTQPAKNKTAANTKKNEILLFRFSTLEEAVCHLFNINPLKFSNKIHRSKDIDYFIRSASLHAQNSDWLLAYELKDAFDIPKKRASIQEYLKIVTAKLDENPPPSFLQQSIEHLFSEDLLRDLDATIVRIAKTTGKKTAQKVKKVLARPMEVDPTPEEMKKIVDILLPKIVVEIAKATSATQTKL